MKRLLQQFIKHLGLLVFASALLAGCGTTGQRNAGPEITRAKAKPNIETPVDQLVDTQTSKPQPTVMKLKAGVQAPTIEIDPKTQQQFNTAMDFMAGSRFDDAERLLLQLTQSHAELSGPYTNLAIIYLDRGWLDQSEAMLQKAIGANPASAAAHNRYGILLRTLGRFEDARSSYQNALVADPRFANAHLNLGVLHDLYLQEPLVAIGHYQQFQELSGTEDKMVKIWISDLTRRHGDKRNAQRGEQ